MKNWREPSSAERAERPQRDAPARTSAAPENPVLVARGLALDGMGNRALLSLLRAGQIQRKARVSQPDDPLEHEADDIADRVMRMSVSKEDEAQQPVQQPDKTETHTAMAKATAGATPRPGAASLEVPVVESLEQSGSGRPLDAVERVYFESRFGWDFSRVRIHTDVQAAQSAAALNAFAYTVGSDIVFGAGQYAPGMQEGRRLLAHELTHVVQQGGASPGAKPSAPQVRGSAHPVAEARQIGLGAPRAVARDSKTPIPFPRVQYDTPTGTFYRRFDGVTTYSMTSREKLAKSGYKFERNDSGHDVWVKLDRSSEIWVQIPKASAPPGPGTGSGAGSPPPKVPTNPDIEEARDWADDLDARFIKLGDEAEKLKAMRNPNGSYPAGPFNDYFKKLNRFDADVKSVLDDEVPLWRGSPITTADERKELEKQITRIKNVQEHTPEMELE